MLIKSDQERKTLVEFCSQATFVELHSLVEELHLRRLERGLTLEDFGQQAQLKTLIHLVHGFGDLKIQQGKPNLPLLQVLKHTSKSLKGLQPKGMLREILSTIRLSWPELVTMFSVLLAEQGMEQLLGTKFAETRNYLQLNRLLYLLFASRLARMGKSYNRREQFIVSEAELKSLLTSTTEVKALPLLPLQSRQWLLSPELLYDDLLRNYVKLATAGRCGDELFDKSDLMLYNSIKS